MRFLSTIPLALLVAAPLVAQARPGDWRVRYDRAAAADTAMKIDQMGPGWHIYTSGRGSGIAWRPSQTASGNFRAENEAFLFPSAGHMDGYGLLLGGRDLDSASQSYVYFLIRRDGQFLIKRRSGAQTVDMVPWTPSAAIVKQEGTENAKNILAAEATADSVTFFVNGQRVHAAPRATTPVDGIVGLRVNHGLSVHVTRVTVTSR